MSTQISDQRTSTIYYDDDIDTSYDENENLLEELEEEEETILVEFEELEEDMEFEMMIGWLLMK